MKAFSFGERFFNVGKYIKGGDKLKVNGKEVIFKENTTVESLLDELKINKDSVVVEINLDILENNQYSEYILREDDVIEVIRFVGGG